MIFYQETLRLKVEKAVDLSLNMQFKRYTRYVLFHNAAKRGYHYIFGCRKTKNMFMSEDSTFIVNVEQYLLLIPDEKYPPSLSLSLSLSLIFSERHILK